MPTSKLLNIDQRIHSDQCKCKRCNSPMPGQRSLWNPSPPVLIIGIIIAVTAIAINYFSFS